MINKKLFGQFLDRATLSGKIEGIKIDSTDQGLSTNFASPDKSLIGFIKCPELSLGNVSCTFGNISALKSILAVFDEEIDFSIETRDDSPFAFLMNDGTNDARLILSHPKSVVAAPKLKTGLNKSISFTINKDFITLFKKSVGAIKNDYFHVLTKNKQGKIIVGYSKKHAASSVTLAPETLVTEELTEAIPFSSSYFSEALSVNKDMESGTFDIDSRGISKLTFNVKQFDQIEYYLMKMSNV